MSKIILTPNSVHYAKEIDEDEKWIRWIPNPNRVGRSKTSKYEIKDILEFHNMDITKEFCFFCGRNKLQLGNNETLTIDHIVSLDENGKDELGNLQVLCSACHKLKNWITLYMRVHF